MATDEKDRSADMTYNASSFSDAHSTPSVTVPIVRATPEALVGFGKLVPDYESEHVTRVTWPKTTGWRPVAAGTGNHQLATEGDYRMHWEGDILYGDNMAVGDPVAIGFATGRLDSSRQYVFVRDANYHPDGGQIFFPPPGGRPFIMLLAPSAVGDDVRPEHFRAFYFDQTGVGFQIAPDVWHQSPYFSPPTITGGGGGTSVETQMVFKNKQSSVFACVATDTVNEFGVYLKVPLRLCA